jgi:hypothetical protein
MIARLELAAIKQREVEESIRARATQAALPPIESAPRTPSTAGTAHADTAHAATSSGSTAHEGTAHADMQAAVASIAGTSPASAPSPAVKAPPRPVVRETTFSPALAITDENQIAALRTMLDHFGQFNEIFLSPFLRKFSDALPRLADFERKALLNDLEAAGAIRIEKRKGEPFDYSVIVVNYNHPTVRRVNPG